MRNTRCTVRVVRGMNGKGRVDTDSTVSGTRGHESSGVKYLIRGSLKFVRVEVLRIEVLRVEVLRVEVSRVEGLIATII